MTAPHQNLLGMSGGVAEEETDPNFNQTVLLLHGDGTNGGQNNTFVDSSSTGHTITRNGNATQGTFNPFLGEGQYSRYLQAHDNIGDTHSDITLGTDDFTIGMFVYPIGYDNVARSLADHVTLYSSSNNELILAHSQFISHYNGSDWNIKINYTTDLVINTWQWIQVDKTGNLYRVSIDGSYVDGGGQSSSDSFGNFGTAQFGYRGGQKDFLGYINNFVLYKGGNRGTIAVPSTFLTASDSNVKILTYQSNRLVNNGNDASITISPNALTESKIIPFSPFAPTASYSESVHGGSGFFDNNGDYLETATSSSLDFNANQFCIEWWEYRTARGSFDIVMHIGFNGTDSYGLLIGYNGNVVYWSSDGSSWDVLSNVNFFGSETRYNNQWYHCVLTRDSSNQFRSFINGVLRYTTSVGTSIIYQAANAIAIGTGQNHDVSHDYEGYLSGINISNGSIPSRYQTSSTTVNTSIFTPPTAPTTSDTDTKLLLNFTNASIIDSTMKNNLETVGDAQIDTSVKKFGTGSIQFDGNDSIRWNQASGTSEQMAIRTGPFTVEFFVYFDGDPNNGGTNGRASLMRDAGNSFVIQRYDGEWEVGSEPTPQIQVAQSLSNQTFYHVALTRDSSNNLRLFIDGTQAGSTATSFTTDFDENQWHLGSFNADGSGGRALTGFMDEVRITKGVARYISDFTAPTKAFANK